MANAAPKSSNTIDTVVDVGIPNVLKVSNRITSVTMTASAADESNDRVALLARLAKTRAEIQAMPVGSYPIEFERPQIDSLVGATALEIQKVLGEPEPGAPSSSLFYAFYNPKPGVRGGAQQSSSQRDVLWTEQALDPRGILEH